MAKQTKPSVDVKLKGVTLTADQKKGLESQILKSISDDINANAGGAEGPGFGLSFDLVILQ